ncbi:hypothetical protein H0H87_012041 [Tephrocybe sp. NHM501043]|nr:hypothetical protein H0H87_012041 [Tephrocybe sp. NHM501043]
MNLKVQKDLISHHAASQKEVAKLQAMLMGLQKEHSDTKTQSTESAAYVSVLEKELGEAILLMQDQTQKMDELFTAKDNALAEVASVCDSLVHPNVGSTMAAVDLPLLQGIELNLNQLQQYLGAPVHNGIPEALATKDGDQYHEETTPIAVDGKTRLLCQLENMDIDNDSQPITRPTPKAAGKQHKQAPKPILLSGKRRKYDFLNSFICLMAVEDCLWP